MIITNSSISMESQRTAQERFVERESLQVWGNNSGAQAGLVGANLPEPDPVSSEQDQETIVISNEAKTRHARGVVTDEATDPQVLEDPKLTVFRLLIERLLGRKIKIIQPETSEPVENPAQSTSAPGQPAGEVQGWGMAYDYEKTYYRSESVQFEATGVINTADGREIDFSLSLSMTSEFMSHESISIRAGEALKDPLVINYAGHAAELTETTFSFDIDMDGHEDQISNLRDGSGFLALDRNEDGLINNGSELFGPATDDGFAELARYDEDHNNWIDENDSIYEKLQVWTRDNEGNNRLFLLGQLGVGALYLGRIETPFSLRDSDDNVLGAVRSTGMFLNENGTVGSMQQLDLKV